ncbi:GNAT family N-acetyltransferase [Flammeovirga sp. EKP202]|uniref:GNAT family N-acetyltransferase n=1 Tax=Flammeovirga sp. EKP202 TaxID=2770592 RepID=UPI00165F61A3|nr:GNAT family N-acetyltransferase [Flammeovirga sp. EKP202]MBD0404355.1 GNAT family N-acetyltransferase [Flammeovirga sp. EKP202]
MNLLLEKTDKIRLIQEGSKLPYDLLLLADETIEAIDKYIHDSEIYIYQRENETLGVYALQMFDGESIEIKNIAVSKTCQGEGIGQRMLLNAMEQAKDRGFKYILIGTSNAAFRQLYIYQKVGFEIYEVKKDFYTKNYSQQLIENGLPLNHMLVLRKQLND